MDWLKAAARERPDAPGVVTPERTFTQRELDRAADGVAAIIGSSGSLGAHPIGVSADRSVETIVACWGLVRAGAMVVLVDPNLAPAKAMELTARVGVRGLWAVPDGGIDGLISHGGSGVAWGPPDSAARFVVFTSGSSGVPKGVVITGANVAASVAASRARLGNGPSDAWLATLPLFHVGGLSIMWRQAESGGPVVLHDRFDAARVADALDTVAFASLVPVMVRRVLALDERHWSGTKAVLVGGAASDLELLRAARRRGLAVVPTYGMTETCSQIATLAPGSPLDGSVGRPLDGAEVQIDHTGRIRVRGPMLSPGYVGEPQRPTGSWHTTGDIGRLEADGRLVVMGRADRVIVTGGDNVDPGEVELLLLAHPDIAAIRVFGVADAEWGERVVAEVESSGATTQDLVEWSAAHLSPVQRPREWRIVQHINEKLEDG